MCDVLRKFAKGRGKRGVIGVDVGGLVEGLEGWVEAQRERLGIERV